MVPNKEDLTKREVFSVQKLIKQRSSQIVARWKESKTILIFCRAAVFARRSARAQGASGGDARKRRGTRACTDNASGGCTAINVSACQTRGPLFQGQAARNEIHKFGGFCHGEKT